MDRARAITVAVAGLGAVGAALVKRLAAGEPGLQLAAVATRDPDRARTLGFAGPVVDPVGLGEAADVVVECMAPAMFRTVAEPVLRAGRILMPLSAGQLLAHEDLVALAAAHGGRIHVPTGGLLGLDAVRAAALGEVHAVTMITRKPPAGFAGAPFLRDHNLSIEALAAPMMLFRGPVREGARGFPANLNVAVALSLAGIGADRTVLEVWADPGTRRNTHTVTVDAEAARFTMTIENVPSPENPRTSRITALSALAALNGLAGPLRVGS